MVHLHSQVYKAYDTQQGGALIGFCDSNLASNRDNCRSQTGYVFNLFGTAVNWKSGLQHEVVLSTTEAEYIVITEALKEAKWLKRILEDFGKKQDTVDIFTFSVKIDIKLYFVRDEVQKGKVRLLKVSTDHNAADMLTKPLPALKFKYCQELVGLRNDGRRNKAGKKVESMARLRWRLIKCNHASGPFIEDHQD